MEGPTHCHHDYAECIAKIPSGKKVTLIAGDRTAGLQYCTAVMLYVK